MTAASRALLFASAAMLLNGVQADQSRYLYVWAADSDYRENDFLAVIDADPRSPGYGDVVTTLVVDRPTHAHHTEHRMPADGQLFVNGFYAGRSYVIDLRDPMNPRLRSAFMDKGQFSYPHSFERLPNGNVIATFQTGPVERRPLGDIAGLSYYVEGMPAFRAARGTSVSTGGIVELTPSGDLVRSSSAANAEHPEVRPYSLAVVPAANRIVTTSSDMWEQLPGDTIQIWRLSDLALLHTISLPPGPRGDENMNPAEPRLMADGSTVLVNTFSCGLYEIVNLSGPSPTVRHVHTLVQNWRNEDKPICALPVAFDRFWVNTVADRNGLVAYDVSDTDSPVEVGYVNFGAGRRPHWISLEPDHARIVVTGDGDRWNEVTMVRVDAETGALSVDTAFGEGGSIDFSRTDWPHGSTGPAVPHGAVFSVR